MHLALTSLGSMEARLLNDGGGLLHRWGPGKPCALLIYLASSGRRTASRDQLIDLLWADAPPDRARATLRQTLSQIRQHLGAEGLAGDDDHVTLTCPTTSDRDRFFEAVERGDELVATERWTGDFLPAFSAPGGLEFEHWADAERSRLSLAWERVAAAGCDALLDSGRPREAAALGRKLRDSNPAKDAAWRPLIESLIASGDRVAALLEADAMMTAIRADHRQPSQATLDLVRRLQVEPEIEEPDAAAPVLDPELIGREREFSRVMAAWHAASQGHFGYLHLTGVAGIGKSRLLDEATRRLRAGGVPVVRLAARWPERRLPYALAADLVPALVALPGARAIAPDAAGPLLALDPSLSATFTGPVDRSDGAEALRRRGLAVAELLRAVANERAFALILDDLQWADAESQECLAIAIARIQTNPILLVSAARPPVGGIAGVELVEALALEPLPADQVASLIESIAAVPPAPWAESWCAGVAASSGGIPLLVLEQVQAALDASALVIDGDQWAVADQARLDDLTDARGIVRRRIESLPTAPRRVVEMLAIAAEPLELSALVSLAGERDVEPALALLERRRFVRREGGGWELGHALIGNAAVDGLSADARAAAHRELAVWFGRSEEAEDLGRAARHWIDGGAPDRIGELFRRFRRSRRAAGTIGPVEAEIAAFLGDDADEILAVRCRRAVPWLDRHRAGMAVTAGVLIAMIGIGSAAGWQWLGQPVRLAVVVQPLTVRPALPIPVIEVQDRLGRLVRNGHIAISVALDPSGQPIDGITTVVTDDGRAEFRNITASAAVVPGQRLRFDAAGLAGVSTHPVLRDEELGLWLRDGDLNGNAVGPGGRVVVVAPGDSIHGKVRLDITSPWPSAAVMLGLTPTWGDPAKSYQTLSALPTPVDHALMSFPIGLRAPAEPGRYALILAFGAEPDARWLMSGTNWSFGHPVWGDGNDLARLDPAMLRQADSTGHLVNQTVLGKDRTWRAKIGITTIQIVVR